jgi:long-subunit fatty acid transport protein
VPAPVLAQNTEDQNTFDFSLPGARSRAIGGAFVAVADDATAAYSNPAGLTLLFRPEISIEGRLWSTTNRAASRGHAFGPATGIGVDNINRLEEDSFHNLTGGLSFLSYVHPLRDRFAIGVFYHQLARYRMDRQIEGPFFDCRGGFRVDVLQASEPFCEPHAIDGVDREFPKLQSTALDIRSVGSSFAYDHEPWRLSIGGGFQVYHFSIDSTNTVFNARDSLKYQPANYDSENVDLVSRQFGTDNRLAFNAGLLWNMSSQWVIGASFRQGPAFEFSTDTERGRASGAPGEHLPPPEEPPSFNVPDTYGLGVLYRPSGLWRLSFEYDRVQYHQLIDDFGNTAFVPGSPEGAVVEARMRLNDSNEIRFGGEYLMLLPENRALSFRGGIWHDPSHQQYFDGDPVTGLPAPRWAILHPRRDGSVHVTGGIGFVTRRHFQLDAAVDFSDVVDTLSISTVLRF